MSWCKQENKNCDFATDEGSCIHDLGCDTSIEWLKKHDSEKHMTLFDYLQLTNGQEITVNDKHYYMEFYVDNAETTDDWGKAILDICKCIEVVKICENDAVETNFSDVIEANIDALDKADLFINCDVDAIMDDIDNIMAGYVSENWMRSFADVLMQNR